MYREKVFLFRLWFNVSILISFQILLIQRKNESFLPCIIIVDGFNLEISQGRKSLFFFLWVFFFLVICYCYLTRWKDFPCEEITFGLWWCVNVNILPNPKKRNKPSLPCDFWRYLIERIYHLWAKLCRNHGRVSEGSGGFERSMMNIHIITVTNLLWPG